MHKKYGQGRRLPGRRRWSYHSRGRSSRPSYLSQPSPLIDDLFVRAQHEAIAFRHGWIGTEHVLLALLVDDASPAGRALRRLGLAADVVRRDVAAIVGTGPPAGAAFDAEALRAMGIDLEVVRARVEETFGTGALDRAERARGRCRRQAGFGIAPRLKQALERKQTGGPDREGREVTAGDVLRRPLAAPAGRRPHPRAPRDHAELIRRALGDARSDDA